MKGYIRKRKRNLKLVMLASIIIGFLGGCGDKARNEAFLQKPLIPVRVMQVKLEDIERTLAYVGSIKAKEEALVYPKVSGKVSVKIKQEQDIVNKGDVIAYIDRDEVGLKFEPAPVESPLKGVIGRIFVDLGTNVTVQTPIALVVDMEEAKINLDIPEEHLSQVKLGQVAKVKVSAYPEKIFLGRVTKISPVLDILNRSAPAEITIPNPDYLLKSGMFGEVELVVEEHKAVPVVMKEALLGREPNYYVFVIEDNVAHIRDVKLGIRKGPYYEVQEGAKEGDLVVIMGQQKLYEGAAVKVEITDKEKK